MTRFVRSAADIQAQAAELLALKSVLARLSPLGDPQHAALDAQILTLKSRFNEQDVYRLYSGDDFVLDACLVVRAWLADEHEPSPCEDWDDALPD